MSATTNRVPSPLGLFPGQATPRLYDRIIEVLRVRHYSRRIKEAYLHWIRRFILFHDRRHPRQLAEGDVNRFSTHLAVKEHVAASTQNQALSGTGKRGRSSFSGVLVRLYFAQTPEKKLRPLFTLPTSG